MMDLYRKSKSAIETFNKIVLEAVADQLKFVCVGNTNWLNGLFRKVRKYFWARVFYQDEFTNPDGISVFLNDYGNESIRKYNGPNSEIMEHYKNNNFRKAQFSYCVPVLTEIIKK